MKKIALTTVVVVLILSISTITALAAGNGYGKGAADVSGTPVSELKPDTPANNAVCPRNENCSNGALCLSTGLFLYKSDCPNDGIAPRDGTGEKNGNGGPQEDTVTTAMTENDNSTPATLAAERQNAVATRVCNENCPRAEQCRNSGVCPYDGDCPNNGLRPRDGSGAKNGRGGK